MQIHVETEKLATYMSMSVQVVIGGTNMNAEAKRIASRAPHVLVGTPGRVLDHLTSDSSSLGRMVQDLRVLIFDEVGPEVEITMKGITSMFHHLILRGSLGLQFCMGYGLALCMAFLLTSPASLIRRIICLTWASGLRLIRSCSSSPTRIRDRHFCSPRPSQEMCSSLRLTPLGPLMRLLTQLDRRQGPTCRCVC